MPVADQPLPVDHQTGDRKIVESATLFDGGSEIVILHNGEQYRLRITRQDKLILTK